MGLSHTHEYAGYVFTWNLLNSDNVTASAALAALRPLVSAILVYKELPQATEYEDHSLPVTSHIRFIAKMKKALRGGTNTARWL